MRIRLESLLIDINEEIYNISESISGLLQQSRLGKDSLLGSSTFSVSIKPKDALAKAQSAKEKIQVRIREVLYDPIISHLSRLLSKTNSPP